MTSETAVAPRRRRLRRMARIGGAVSGQLTQALISFGLQAVALRALGAEGLGTYALAYSVIVTSAAVSNGLVGDSLTVLDRSSAPVRAALQRWALLSSAGAGLLTALALWGLGFLGAHASVWFALASATFMLEGLLRRLLMTALRFWAVVAVDLAGLAASVVVLALWATVSDLDVAAMLLALTAGQVVAGVVAVVLLSPDERWWSREAPAMREVWAYGSLRAVQQLIRPSLLTLVRVVLVVEAGREAFGRLEAARVYVAPGLLVVQGLGTYLFASYARDREAPLARLRARADRTAAVMAALTLGLGTLATVLSDAVGPLLTGGAFDLEPAAVLGWSVFAAATAANSPYASLAAVRGRQRRVIVVALVSAALTLVATGAAILLGAPVAIAPYLIGLGLLAQALVLRLRVLDG